MIRAKSIVCIASAILLSACARVPYQYLHPEEPGDNIYEEGEQQFERGEPVGVVDFLGHYVFSLPSKLILFNWKVENHDISEGTAEVLSQYLHDNDMNFVKVRLNEYSPGGEWQRLISNSSVGAGWRYTIGLLSWLGYTIFPGRVFGGDSYNPFTNTINLYSDLPTIAIHEGGHAKDFANTEWKGSYAALSFLPLISLFFEGEATGDAFGYLKDKQCLLREKDAYKLLYPAYCTYIGGEAVSTANWFTPLNSVWHLAAVIPGHIVGRIKAANVETEEDQCAIKEEEPAPHTTTTPAPAPDGPEEKL